MASRRTSTSLLSALRRLLSIACACALSACAGDVSEDSVGAISSQLSQQKAQAPTARACDPDDHLKRCKRDKDCPKGHYCADDSDDGDDHRGNGHDKHDHHHGDKGGVCRPRDIDDGNPCTVDSVDKGVVKHAPAPAGTSCEDGNACNGRETCSGQAQCLPGTPPPLSDGNPCTLDSCDAALGVRHSPVAAGTSCADQDACDGAETCDASGACRDGVPLDLDDHNPCTVDSCQAATGAVHTPLPAGTSCADADQCNSAEACDGSGQCRSGAPSTSDDGNPCTIDACDPLGGVTHPPAPAGTSCDDGNPCNGHGACNGAGSCVDAAPPNLDDGNPCTADSCDPATGVKHEPVANGSACGDTNPCNGSEACTDGVCQLGVAPALDDHNPCTEDRCDAATGVEHLPVPVDTPCGDADACNGTERCSADAQCQAGSPAALDDGNPCTVDGCDAATGVSHPPAPAGTSCADANPCNGQELCDANGNCQPGAPAPVDDGNPCTVDGCAPDGSVEHAPVPAGTSCADANPCDSNELCDAGGHCAAAAPPLLDDANPCTSDSCDPALGIVHLPVPSGSSCADADHCNGNETCDGAGHCLQSAPSPADDHDPCTIDACEPGTGITHSPAPAGTPCDDGNACDGVSACDGAGQCAGGTAPARDDLNPCTLDTCEPQFGVLHSPLPAGTACSDGNACNGLEVCGTSGSCEPGLPPVLDDGNPCTLETCDPQQGVFALPAPPGTGCGDGNPCNGAELCSSGGFCQPGEPPLVDDQNPCTLDSCTPDLGLLHEPLPAGTSCGNGDLCDGDELCDASGECHAGAARCDDGNACNGVEQCNPDGSCSAIPHQLLVVSSPAANSLTREASVVVSGATHAPSPVVVTIAPGGLSTTVPGDSEPRAFTLTVPLAEGPNQLTVQASTEPACSASVALTVVRDSIAPALTLEAPERLALGEAALVSVTASDAGGIAEVRFRLKLRGEVVFEQARSSAPFSFDFTVPEAALAGDSLQLEAVALDQAGNSGQASRSLTLTAAAIVVGRVLSDATGQPLSASVRLDGSTATTRPDGRYVFSARDNQVVVRAFRQGFTSVERKAPIQFGVGSVAFDARLTPLAEPVLVNGSDVSHGAVLGTWNGQPMTATFGIPASAFAGAAALHVTPLSPQGLPGLLPPGWSPVAALETRLAAADTNAPETNPDAAFPPLLAPLTLELAGLPPGPLLLVAYDRGQHAWRTLEVIDAGVVPVTRSLAGLGVFALLLADPNGPALPPGGTLLADGAAPAIPPTAVAQGAGVPSSLSAGGGVTQGRVVLSSSPALASGTLVSAALTESYLLSSGLTASTETTLQDLVLYRAQPPSFPGAPSGSDLLGAVFPIATSFSFGIADLTSGNLHLDVLAGREAHRGKIGGHAPVVVEHSGASFAVVENSLETDTLIDLERTAVADFLIRSPELVPVAQLALDLSGSQLSQSGELRLSGLPLPVEETPLLARLERVDGVAYPSVVALGNYDGSEWSFTSGDGFAGILKEGTYVVYRAALPLGFVAGTARAGGAPVQALVSAAQVPFVAVAGLDGSYQLPVRPGAAALTARITGTNLVARGEVAVTVDRTSRLDLALVGELTTAVVSPLDGAVAVPRTTQLTLSTPVALDPATLTEANIRLFAGAPSDNVLVDIRLQISANARSVAVIPELRLAEGADYTLLASGLRDAQGGLVVVPITSFRTEVEAPDVVDTDPIEVTLPEGDGNAHVVAPPGSLDPGSTVLITNEGNGHVVSCSVGNGGGLDCEIPASTDDTLVISITDGDGNTRTVRRSQYQLSDGRTAIGSAGGTVRGPEGFELRVPEDAIPTSVVFKLSTVDPGSLAPPPAMEGGVVAGAIRVETEGNPVFAREIDLAFPKPAGAPDGAFYFVHRQLAQTPDRPLAGGVAFEVIDHAFVQGTGSNARVVTASCPFPGFARAMDTVKDGWSLFSLGKTAIGIGGRLTLGLRPFLTGSQVADLVGEVELLGQSLNPADILLTSGIFLLTYTHDALAPAVPKVGLIRGSVQRATIDANTGLPSFEPITDAEVTGVDASGRPFIDNPTSNQPAHIAYSQAPDGKFTLWDTFPTQGQVREICARLPTSAGGVDQRCVTPIQEVVAHCGDNTKYYRNQLKATITFPALPATSRGDSSVQIRVLHQGDNGRQLSNGLFTVGEQVVISFTNEDVEVRSVEIAHQGVSQSLSVRRDPLSGQPLGGDQIAEFVAGTAGTFTVTALAQPVFGGPLVTKASTFRVVIAGGEVTTPVPDEPPRILDGRTVPSDGADGIHPSITPQFVFTEPVKNVPAHVEFLEDQAGKVDAHVIGIGLDGLPVTLLEDSAGAQKTITALTIEPKRQLKFGRTYRIKLKDGIFDLDNTLPGAAPAPRALVPYEISFTTLQPQALTDPGMGFSSPGIVSLGDRAYVVENNFINGVLRVFDISDPASPTEISSAQRQMAGRPMDLDVQDDGNGGANVTVVTGPVDSSFPSNLRVYHVPASPPSSTNASTTLESRWVAGATLTSTAAQGIVRRVAVRGGFAYTLTTFKGLQVIDLAFARQLFTQGGGDTSRIRVPFNTDGMGFGHEAVVATIPIYKGTPPPPPQLPRHAFLADLQVADLVDGIRQPLVVATGDMGLAIVNPQTAQVLFNGGSSGTSWPSAAFRGQALAVTRIGDADMAIIVGRTQAGGIQTRYVLLAVDVSDPRHPVLRGELADLADDPSDVHFTQGLAIVANGIATAAGSTRATIVNVEDPASPFLAGTIADMGGRLALTGQEVVLSAMPSSTGGNVYLGGIRAAALDIRPIIGHVPPIPARRLVMSGLVQRETLQDAWVPVAVFGAKAGIVEAVVRVIATDNAAQQATVVDSWTVPLSLTNGKLEGRLRLPSGLLLPESGTITVVAEVTPPALAAPVKSIPRLLDVGSRLVVSAPPDSVWADGRERARVTVRVMTSNGLPLGGESVDASVPSPATIRADPARRCGQACVLTDEHGEAQIEIASDDVGAIDVSLSDRFGNQHLQRVRFERRKVAILVQGIRTDLCCSAGSCFPCASAEQWAPLIARLAGNGFDIGNDKPDQILWYSYQGGRVDSDSGRWVANSYVSQDTKQAHRVSIAHLHRLLLEYGEAHPNTDFYLLGHSQGGLIAFQSLGLVDRLSPRTRLGGVVTLDGALGGAPMSHVVVPSLLGWGDPAKQDMIDLWESADSHDLQGTTADAQCSRAGIDYCCSSSYPTCPFSNYQLVEVAREIVGAQGEPPPQVLTIGNVDDGAFSPEACGLLPDITIDNVSTQIVLPHTLQVLGGNTLRASPPVTVAEVVLATTAHGAARAALRAALGSTGERIFDAIECTTASHSHVISTAAPQAMGLIGAQYP
jgi:hypothetical protein